MAKRYGAINMTQAAAKEALKGLEGENRVGSLMGWTTNKEREKKCSRFLMLLRSYICARREGREELRKRDEEEDLQSEGMLLFVTG